MGTFSIQRSITVTNLQRDEIENVPNLRDLEQGGSAHPTADAHRRHHPPRADASSGQQRMTDEPLPGHAIRVPDGDRPAVDVEAVVRYPELVTAIDDLDRKRLVELPEVDVLDL